MMMKEGIDFIFDITQLQTALATKMDQVRFDKIIRDTPEDFRKIAHYAAIWGVSDDGYRGNMIRNASKRARENLRYVVGKYENGLENWLTGDEAGGPEFSEAFIAFSAMIMAYDEVS